MAPELSNEETEWAPIIGALIGIIVGSIIGVSLWSMTGIRQYIRIFFFLGLMVGVGIGSAFIVKDRRRRTN